MRIINKPSTLLDKLCSFDFDCVCGTRLKIDPADILVKGGQDDPQPIITCGKCQELRGISMILMAVCNRDNVVYDDLLAELRMSEEISSYKHKTISAMNLFNKNPVN